MKTVNELFLSYWREVDRRPEIIDLGMGMPPTDPFYPEIDADLRTLLDTAQRADYQPQAGPLALREAIAEYETKRSKLKYDLSNVMLVGGALRGFSLVIDCLIDKLKSSAATPPSFVEIVPTYPLLAGHSRNVARRHGLEIHTVEPKDRETFQVQAEEVIPQIREASITFLTNPNNPTGLYVRPGVLSDIIRRCEEVGAYLIIDEASDIPLAGHTRDFSGHDSHSVIRIKSLSKDYLLAGVRLGYVVARDSLIELFSKSYSFSDGNAPLVANAALARYVRNATLQDRISAITSRQVDFTVDLLRKAPRVRSVIKPEGCYYMLLRIEYSGPNWDLFMDLANSGFNTLPGILFGLDARDPCIRLCCARHDDALRDAVTKFTEVLDTLPMSSDRRLSGAPPFGSSRPSR